MTTEEFVKRGQAAQAEFDAWRRTLMLDPPKDALELLRQTALHDTGGSRAARNILRWLWAYFGGLELRALDFQRRAAALDVIAWWGGCVKSHDPLEKIIDEINENWPPEECPMCRRQLARKEET